MTLRKKTLRALVTFYSTTDAMAVEALCTERGVPGRIIPVPSVITADCGLCWSAPEDAKETVVSAAEAAGVQPAGIYEMML